MRSEPRLTQTRPATTIRRRTPPTGEVAAQAHEGNRKLNVIDDPAVRELWTVEAVRERAHELLALCERGALEHFSVDAARIDPAAELVAQVTRERHPDLQVPLHSRWRHFERPDAPSRWNSVAGTTGLRGAERARSAVELAVVSVLLDAGAGSSWRYRDGLTGTVIGRSEGLAAATFDLYRQGTLSSDPQQPLCADAGGLGRIDRSSFEHAFQLGPHNPLSGVAGRIRCLHSLGRAVAARPEFARAADPAHGADRRLGHLFDHIRDTASEGRIPARDLFRIVMTALRGVIGRALGDVWPHPGIRRRDHTDGLLALHKLFLWLTWSLVEPLAEGGVSVTDTQALTGLAEYRNGGLLIDTGVLVPRHPIPDRPLSPGDPIVVEWRGLTVALLDRLRPRVAKTLGVAEPDFTIGQLLEGGTWWAGRRIAMDLREGGPPPIRTLSAGTLF